jgi:hypothetical protein
MTAAAFQPKREIYQDTNTWQQLSTDRGGYKHEQKSHHYQVSPTITTAVHSFRVGQNLSIRPSF